MSTDLEQAFLNSILDDPESYTPRAVYADWLEEQGDPWSDVIRTFWKLGHAECESQDLQAAVETVSLKYSIEDVREKLRIGQHLFHLQCWPTIVEINLDPEFYAVRIETVEGKKRKPLIPKIDPPEITIRGDFFMEWDVTLKFKLGEPCITADFEMKADAVERRKDRMRFL